MDKEEFLRVSEDFAKNNNLIINPDQKIVDFIVKGILRNFEKYGLKYCPCRVVSKDFEKNLEIICPCNFKTTNRWQEQGLCGCGLFMKRK